MGKVIEKIVETLLDIFEKNYKRPKLWITLGAFVCVIIFLIPYIDSNFFYYARMEKRIDILERLISLDQTKIKSNQTYINEYQSLLQEIEQQREHSLNSLMNKLIYSINSLKEMGRGEGNRWILFLTGSFWFIIITICIPFMDTFSKKSEKILAFVIMVIITALVGMFFSMIPIIISPFVNYIGVPILQLILVIVIVYRSEKKDRSIDC